MNGYIQGYIEGKEEGLRVAKEKYLDADAYNEGIADGRASAIEEFQSWLKTQVVGIDNSTKEILVVRDDRWELAIDAFKEQDNGE